MVVVVAVVVVVVAVVVLVSSSLVAAAAAAAVVVVVLVVVVVAAAAVVVVVVGFPARCDAKTSPFFGLCVLGNDVFYSTFCAVAEILESGGLFSLTFLINLTAKMLVFTATCLSNFLDF